MEKGFFFSFFFWVGDLEWYKWIKHQKPINFFEVKAQSSTPHLSMRVPLSLSTFQKFDILLTLCDIDDDFLSDPALRNSLLHHEDAM